MADSDPNVRFYRNELPSRPHGALVDDLIARWDGDFDLLEVHHGYIQWIFPVFENAGMNWESAALTKEGASLLRADPVVSERVIRAYRLMLRFYGLRLRCEKTGAIARDPDLWEERLQHLNHSPHNWLRVSRIITSLGELGFARYKAPLLRALRAEVEAGTLRAARSSLERFWAPLVVEEGSDWYRAKTRESAEDRAPSCLFLPGGRLAGEAVRESSPQAAGRGAPRKKATPALARGAVAATAAALAAALAVAFSARAATADHSLPMPTAPELRRDLGFMAAATLAQLTDLVDVEGELSQLPTRCAVCRLMALEAHTMGVLAGLQGGAVGAQSVYRTLCARVDGRRQFGTLARRRVALLRTCDGLLPELAGNLTAAAAGLSGAAAARRLGSTSAPAASPAERACAALCPVGPVRRWPALVEVALGHEPLSKATLSKATLSKATLAADEARGGGAASLPDLAPSLLYFAAAKSDATAVQLLVALSGAASMPPSYEPHALRLALVRLMSPPSARQQLGVVRSLAPSILREHGGSDAEAIAAASAARFDMRLDGTADTALHAAAYSYDRDAVLALLLGGADVNAADSKGRTALHLAADALDQLHSLVYKFAPPPEGEPTLLEQRSASGVRMAADVSQDAMVNEELASSQASTVQVLLAFGADANAASRSGRTPLQLAAKAGAREVVRLLVDAGASVDSRDDRGMTALHVAGAAGQAAVCSALLAAGAEREARDGWGLTPVERSTGLGAAMLPSEAAALWGRGGSAGRAAVSGSGDDAAKGEVSEVSEAGNSERDGGWGAADHPAPASWGEFAGDDIDVCEVARRDHTLSAAAFEAEFLVPGRPVLITGAARSIAAAGSWTRRRFFEVS